MELTDEQIKKFKKIHEKYGCFDNFTDEKIRRIANGVGNYYLTLYKIYMQNKKEHKQDD